MAPSPRDAEGLFLVLHRLVLPVSIGIRVSVLRPRLTSAPPAEAFAAAFRPFEQALLVGATTAREPSEQISPDKNVVCRRASSPFTCVVDRERLRSVVPARLTAPAWYGVSVRNLATLVRMRLTTIVPVSFTTHSQASSPRRVASTQLPSPRALPIGVFICMISPSDFPISHRGLVLVGQHPIKPRPCRAYTMR